MSLKDKNTRILILYYQLLTGKMVSKQTFCLEQGITERSFDRDIEDIRIYLSEEHPYCELLYDRIDKKYYITHTIGKTISGEEALILADMLISQNYLRSDELDGIISSLLDITDSYRRNIVYEFINKAISNHIERKVAVLKMHWDLAQCITNRNQISLYYEKYTNVILTRKVNPVELHFDGGHIYLIAYIADEKNEYPAFYRLDRIQSFKVENFKFSERIYDKYKKINIHQNMVHMLAGEKVTVKLQVTYNMKRIVDDVFPENHVITENIENCIMEVSALKQGLVSWVLSQGNKVMVLEPADLRLEMISIIKSVYELYIG